MFWLGVICLFLCGIILVQAIVIKMDSTRHDKERQRLMRLITMKMIGKTAYHAYEGTDEPTRIENEPVG